MRSLGQWVKNISRYMQNYNDKQYIKYEEYKIWHTINFSEKVQHFGNIYNI